MWLPFTDCHLRLFFQHVYARDSQSFKDGERLFAIHIQPLLAAKCLACHGDNPNEIEGGLDMRSRESLLKGGDAFEKD
ncbi:MAG: c-type cytochrome domain-containing protein, partial [Pirellulales bacterium]